MFPSEVQHYFTWASHDPKNKIILFFFILSFTLKLQIFDIFI